MTSSILSHTAHDRRDHSYDHDHGHCRDDRYDSPVSCPSRGSPNGSSAHRDFEMSIADRTTSVAEV